MLRFSGDYNKVICFMTEVKMRMGFPGDSVVKNPPINADMVSIPVSGRSLGEGNGKLKFSCLGNPMDRGVWWATVHGVTKELDMT